MMSDTCHQVTLRKKAEAPGKHVKVGLTDTGCVFCEQVEGETRFQSQSSSGSSSLDHQSNIDFISVLTKQIVRGNVAEDQQNF